MMIPIIKHIDRRVTGINVNGIPEVSNRFQNTYYHTRKYCVGLQNPVFNGVLRHNGIDQNIVDQLEQDGFTVILQ